MFGVLGYTSRSLLPYNWTTIYSERFLKNNQTGRGGGLGHVLPIFEFSSRLPIGFCKR